MVWQKFSDRARESRKVRSASDRGIVLWWAIGNWCSEHETDGFIPKAEVKDAWRPLRRGRFRYADVCAELVEIGLLEDHETHYKVHDFDQFNPTKAALEEARSGQRTRASRHRSRQKTEQKQGPNPKVTHAVTRVTERESNGPRPVPTRSNTERDHASRALSLAAAGANENGFGPDEMWTLFAKRWLDVIGTFPSHGGSNLGEFANMVRQTATAQQRDPRELFTSALEKYLGRKHEKIELRSPYACFAKAWGELTARDDLPKPKLYDGLTLAERVQRDRQDYESRLVGGVFV